MHNFAFAQDWQSSFYTDHVLVGKIWDTGKKKWLSENQLQTELAEYEYILLGEIHNNADHHVLQAELLESLVQTGQKPTVVMEMLAQSSWQNQSRTWSSVELLQNQAAELNSAWPWDLYTPILDKVVKYRLELMAGNIDSKALHEWANNLADLQTEDIFATYKLTQKNIDQLHQDIIHSHCGHANADLVDFMTLAQLQRDHVITTTLVKSKKPVVLIAGAGHVRNDYAVPMQLINIHKQISYISIAFVSVLPDLQNPEDYLDDKPKKYDILYFTPSNTDEDPCEKFKKQLEKINQTPKSN